MNRRQMQKRMLDACNGGVMYTMLAIRSLAQEKNLILDRILVYRVKTSHYGKLLKWTRDLYALGIIDGKAVCSAATMINRDGRLWVYSFEDESFMAGEEFDKVWKDPIVQRLWLYDFKDGDFTDYQKFVRAKD